MACPEESEPVHIPCGRCKKCSKQEQEQIHRISPVLVCRTVLVVTRHQTARQNQLPDWDPTRSPLSIRQNQLPDLDPDQSPLSQLDEDTWVQGYSPAKIQKRQLEGPHLEKVIQWVRDDPGRRPDSREVAAESPIVRNL